MNFCFQLPDIVELLLSLSTSHSSAVSIIPAVEPFSTIREDASRAVDILIEQDSFEKTKKKGWSTKPISRRRALRGSHGRVHQKL